MEKKFEKKSIWIILLILFAAGLLISALVYGKALYDQRKAEEGYRAMAANVNTIKDVLQSERETTAELGIEIPEKNIDFASLQEQNPDIYAWIYVPGTDVDYPVLQHPTDDSYYLERNVDGSIGKPGCIYTESINSKDFTDSHTVLYGHNWSRKGTEVTGTMFTSLHNFEDGQVFEDNPYFFIYTPDKTYVYQIFGAYEFIAIHLLKSFDLSTKEIFQEYLDSIFDIRDMDAHIRRDVEVTADNHIVTLSTCVNGDDNMRYLVQGVLLNDGQ